MNIYTSYFGNYRKFGDKIPISIALYPPKGFLGEELKALAPTTQILGCKDNEEVYTTLFNKKIKGFSAKKVFKYFESSYNDRDVILLCYEKPPQFCHRHLVAEWLEKELGIEVEELEFKK
jgi:hypothetical protein